MENSKKQEQKTLQKKIGCWHNCLWFSIVFHCSFFGCPLVFLWFSLVFLICSKVFLCFSIIFTCCSLLIISFVHWFSFVFCCFSLFPNAKRRVPVYSLGVWGLDFVRLQLVVASFFASFCGKTSFVLLRRLEFLLVLWRRRVYGGSCKAWFVLLRSRRLVYGGSCNTSVSSRVSALCQL